MDITFNELKPSNIAFVDETGDYTPEPKNVFSLSELANHLPNENNVPNDIVVEVKYEEPNDFEKQMNKGTFTPSEYAEFELKEKLENEEKEKNMTEEEKLEIKKKEIITMVKTIALSRCGKNPLSNPSKFDYYEKEKVKDEMKNILFNTEEEIIKEFRAICVEKIFPNPNFYTYG